MKVRYNVPIYDICWLNHASGGVIKTFYEPCSVVELKKICIELYDNKEQYDLIGHTSNIYFLPQYSVDYMVSTRRCNHYSETAHEIICECGVSVSKLSRRMVSEGVKGFEGLIDLPGTVGAAVYGNASCFKCSINNLLISCELLCPDGTVKTLFPDDLQLTTRSSVLKRDELKGVILTVKLIKEKGDVNELQKEAEINHIIRKTTQPGPKDNLGSIYAVSGGWSLYSIIPRFISKCYAMFLILIGKDKIVVKQKQRAFLLYLLGAKDIYPYIYGWNRYIWKDEQSHALFWKYHKVHQLLFRESVFEIEIKE